jgi:hypothetical protein
MISRTPTLAGWPYRMVRLACDYCPRRGQYRKETLIARFGGAVLMPDVRHLIAECPRKDAPGQACAVFARTRSPLVCCSRDHPWAAARIKHHRGPTGPSAKSWPLACSSLHPRDAG